MLREFEINCPGCEGWIIIDLDTGEVLRHGKKKESRRQKDKKVDPKKFQQAMDRLKKREESGDDTFDDAVRSVEKQKKKLEDAFDEARKRASENPDDRPLNPLDDLFA